MAQDYTPLYRLAAGGMAEVWVAQSISVAGFKKKVAIKRILPGLLKDDRFVRMFLDEARLSLHFNHANVVSVFDLGKSDETYFIVMEYVQGTTLKRVLEFMQEQGRRVPLPLVIWILNETLKGLDYAHNLPDPETGEHLDVVHRDISPPNLLISWNGEVKLTDFGLAKATSQLESTDQGVVKGKFSYLSPEAAHGRAVDGRTDVFAVGILAYEMLTMKRLFLGETDYQTVELVRAAKIPSIRKLNPEVPEELERIILKSLAQHEDDRYASAADFADDLLSFLFSHRLKVSTRDLQRLLAELRKVEEAKLADKRNKEGPANLIMQLMAEEMANFRSIDDDSGGGQSPAGAGSLLDDEDLGSFDATAPLVDGLDDLLGPDLGGPAPPATPPPPALPPASPAQPAASARPAPPDDLPDPDPDGITEHSIAHTRLPSPAPKQQKSNSTVWVMILLLLLGGGAVAAYFLLIAS